MAQKWQGTKEGLHHRGGAMLLGFGAQTGGHPSPHTASEETTSFTE